MGASTFTEFNLPRNAYTAFDAVSMKQLITNRLKASGQFPDIDYEGSNITGLVEIVAYMYHVLMYYINQTATETLFSQAELYENINKLIALIGYKPQGYQTCLLNFDFTAKSALPTGLYTLKRFSYVYVNSTAYTFNADIAFEKTSTTDQLIEAVGSNYTLQQGIMKEYPLYTAIGESYEQFTLAIAVPSTSTTITYVDHNNIFVFVKDVSTQTWSEWTEVSNLYGSNSTASVFEKRLNENGRYELKFGNGVTGKKLNTGDTVAVYYLQSDGSAGSVGSNTLSEKTIALFNTTQWNEIFEDIKDQDQNYMTADQIRFLQLSNSNASTNFTAPETVEEIRQNVPLLFSAQNRTVSVEDYESVVRKNFSNIITDVKVVNNKDYTSSYLKYFYDIGLERPNDNQQVLFNQVTFTDACDFNNVYVFVVPKYGAIQDETTPVSLPVSQKQLIYNYLTRTNQVNQNIVLSDPVYLAFNFGLALAGEEITVDVKDETILRIYRSSDYTISKELIKSKAANLITDFFSQTNNTLNGVLNLTQLNINILSIPGVQKIETVRTGTTEYSVPKINMLVWNPLYEDVEPFITSQNIQLKFYEYPFFYQVSDLINRIEVV